MGKGKELTWEAEQEQYNTKVSLKNVSKNMCRISDFMEKLEQTYEWLSVVIERKDGEEEVEQFI